MWLHHYTCQASYLDQTLPDHTETSQASEALDMIEGPEVTMIGFL